MVNIVTAMKNSGCAIVEAHSRADGPLRRLSELVAEHIVKGRYADILWVGAAGQRYVFLAKVLSLVAGQKLVLDAFISHYLVVIKDLEKYPERSLQARALWLLDRWACLLADEIVLDSEEHVEYFIEEFGISRDKLSVVRLGADPSIFFPGQPIEKRSQKRVLYYGTFFPLQGARLIARAARAFVDERTQLQLAGDGPEKEDVLSILEESDVENVVDVGWVERTEIGELIRQADVCLGHFGQTRQAQVVVPFKVYEVLACSRPLIMGRAAVVERFLEHRRHIFFCDRGSAKDLATAVKEVLKDEDLRRRLAAKGRKRFEVIGGCEVLAKQLTQVLTKATES